MDYIGLEKLDSVLKRLDISDIGTATIRQCVLVAGELEKICGEKFIHLEFGVPGLAPCHIGVEAQKAALDRDVAAVYPSAAGIPELKEAGVEFVKAFVDVDVKPEDVIPAVGSMQSCYNLLLECSQLVPGRNKIVYFDPGFSSHYLQAKVLGLEALSFDLSEHRGESLRQELETLFCDGTVCAVVYSNPNNPSWMCLTEDELRILGEMCTKYDVIALEDMAYLCMDFRKDMSVPYHAPFQPTVARYTDNWVIMISASKIFSYAGERIAIAVISDKLFHREFPALKARYNRGKFGDNFALTYMYVNASSTSHSSQYAFAAMMRAAVDGTYDFVNNVKEYAIRAHRAKEIFIKHGFHFAYDKDLNENVSDGFFFTIAYGDMTGRELQKNLMCCGICSISLVSSRGSREGVRVCVSLLKDEDSFRILDERLAMFSSCLGK